MTRHRDEPPIDLGVFEEPADDPVATIEELVDDGVLISMAAVRLAIKNVMILRALRDRLDFDDDWYVGAVQQELLGLAVEKEADAARVATARDDASQRRGRPEHPADYRLVDFADLDRREHVLSSLARRLRELSEDRDLAHRLLAAARDTALHEMSRVGVSATDPDYGIELDQRLEGIKDDLAELLLESQLGELGEKSP